MKKLPNSINNQQIMALYANLSLLAQPHTDEILTPVRHLDWENLYRVEHWMTRKYGRHEIALV